MEEKVSNISSPTMSKVFYMIKFIILRTFWVSWVFLHFMDEDTEVYQD